MMGRSHAQLDEMWRLEPEVPACWGAEGERCNLEASWKAPFSSLLHSTTKQLRRVFVVLNRHRARKVPSSPLVLYVSATYGVVRGVTLSVEMWLPSSMLSK